MGLVGYGVLGEGDDGDRREGEVYIKDRTDDG